MTDPTKDILEAFDPVFLSQHRYCITYGGAGSGKSYAAAQKVILRCLLEPGHRIPIIRKVGTTLRNSVFQRVISQLSEWGLYSVCKITYSGMSVIFPNGSELLFLGLDDVEKLKSIDRITSVWIEEATELSETDIEQVDLRLRGITPYCQQILFTFNPISRLHHLKKRVDEAGVNTFVHKSTFRDNPHCGEQYAQVLLALKKRNPAMGAVYADGDWGILEGLIYRLMDYSPWPSPHYVDQIIYGMDFGYSSPTALVECRILEDRVWLKELIYEPGLDTDSRIQRLKDIGVSKRAPIYGDTSHPADIEAIYKAGFNIFPADKCEGSVFSGLTFIQCLHLHTCADNVNLNKEAENYTWAVDKNGKRLDEPIKENDHAMDAMRYALWTHLRPKLGGTITSIKDYEQEFGHLVPELTVR